MSNDYMTKILDALNLQLSPTATQEDRLSTFKFLNHVLESPQAEDVAKALSPAGTGYPDHVRFFGLKCFEFVVRYQWNSRLSDEARLSTITSVEQLACQGLQSCESTLIKTKVATIIVEVAKREWPQVWDLNNLLTRMFGLSNTHKQVVLLTLSTLSQDVFVPEFIDEIVASRKRLLMKALNSIVLSDDVYLKQIQKDLQPFQSSVKEVEYLPGEQGRMGWFLVILMSIQPYAAPDAAQRTQLWSGEAHSLLITALGALSNMVPWTSAELMIQSNLLSGVSALLEVSNDLQVRYAASELLYNICSRTYHGREEVEALFGPFLNGGYLNSVLKCLYALDQNDEEAFDIMKLLVQAIVDIGVKQICGKQSTWIPATFPDYISAVLGLQYHPSVVLSTSIVTFWLSALKHNFIKMAEPTINALPQVLEKALLTLERDPPKEEFSTRKRREQAIMALHTHVKSVVKLVGDMSPVETCSWLMAQLNTNAHLAGVLQMIDGAYQELLKAPSSVLPIYQYLVSMARQWPTNQNEDMLCNLVRSASFCVGAVGTDVSQLLLLLEFLVTYKSEQRYIRYILLGQLSKIALVMPDFVYMLAPDIENVSKELALPERCHVIECIFVSIIHTNHLASPSDGQPGAADKSPRELRVRQLLDPMANMLTTSITQAMPNIDGLVRLCAPEEDVRQIRSSIMLPIVTFNAAFKRANASPVPHILDSYVVELCERVMHLISLSHQLTDPALAKDSPFIKFLQDTPHHIKNSFLQDLVSDRPAPDKKTLKVQMWVEQIKPNAYTLLGNMLQPPFYQISNISEHIIRMVFTSLESLENRHLGALLRCFVEPLIANCPENIRRDIIVPILPQLTSFVIARLQKEWTSYLQKVAGDKQAQASSDSDEEDEALTSEIIRERQLSTFTLDFVDMISIWFMQGRKRKVETGLLEFVFAPDNAMLLECVLMALLSPFSFNESRAIIKALMVFKILLPHFTQAHHAALATGMLRGLIAGLKNSFHADIHEQILSFITSLLGIVLKGPQSEQVLTTLLEEGVPRESIMHFIESWTAQKAESDREAIVRAVLKLVTTSAVADKGKLQKSAAITRVNKLMIAPQQQVDDDHLGDLFDETNALEHLY